MKKTHLLVFLAFCTQIGCASAFNWSAAKDLDFLASLFGFGKSKSYLLGGNASGLTNLTGLKLQNADEILSIDANGTFQFKKQFKEGETYQVTINSYPVGSDGGQTCVIAGDTGTFGAADAITISVTCADAALIEVSVSGLSGTGLSFLNNGGNSLSVSGNGTAAFSVPLSNGASYNVTVGNQPISVWQTCVATSANGGTVVPPLPGKITINFQCTTNTYNVKAYVTGLAAPYTGTVDVRESANSIVDITAIGNYAAASASALSILATLPSGSAYTVTVSAGPTIHTCTPVGGTGTVGGGDAIVQINCAPFNYTLTGTITGLLGSGLTLTAGGLTQNIPAGSTSYAFSLPHGTSYTVSPSVQPSGPSVWQTCTVSSAAGTISAANASGVDITCTPNIYNVNVQISGYDPTDVGNLVLGLNSATPSLTIPPANSGLVQSVGTVSSGNSYNIFVISNPSVTAPPAGPSKYCTAVAGSGTITNGSVTVTVNCINSPSVILTVQGYASGFTITDTVQNNSRTISGNGVYSFPVPAGGNYNLTIPTLPTNQACVYTSGSASGSVANIEVAATLSCTPIVTFTSPGESATNTGSPTTISVHFNKSIASGLTFNGGTKICQGNFQVSMNDFVSCVPITTATNSVLTTRVDLDVSGTTLWYGTGYKIKVLNAVTDTNGQSMAYSTASYLSSAGFNTGGLLRRYDFGSGSLTDSGSQAVNLTNSGGASFVTGADADASGAPRLDGTSQYLTAMDTGLPSGATARTLCSWISLNKQPASTADIYPVISYGTQNTGQGTELVYTHNGSNTILSLTTFGTPALSQTVTLPLNTWIHLCSRFSGTTGDIFVNGTSVGSGTIAIANTTLGGELRIGRRIGTSDYFPGKIDGVRVYNASLGNIQIGYLSAQIPTGLRARYNLNASGLDTSGFDFDIQAFGTTAAAVDRFGIASSADRFTSGGHYYNQTITTLPTTQTATVTLTAWIKPTTINSENVILNNGHSSITGYTLFLGSTGEVCGILGGIQLACSTGKVSKNIWTHVAFRGNNGDWDIFWNGIKVKDNDSPSPSVTPNAPTTSNSYISIGNQPNPIGSAPFTGEIDDARIYEVALSDAQIRHLAGFHPFQVTGAVDIATNTTHTLSLYLQAGSLGGDSGLSGGSFTSTIWNDSGPRGANTTASAGTLNYLTSGIGGQPSVQFATSAYFTSNGNNLTGGADASIFYLFQTPSTNAASEIANFHPGNAACAGGQELYYDTSNQFFFSNCGVGSIGSSGFTTSTNYIGETIVTGSLSIASFYNQTGSFTSGLVGLAAFAAPQYYTIGYNQNSGSPLYFPSGQISEIIYYNTSLSVSDRNKIRCYLSTKYRIPVPSTVSCD
ncbi:LamG domain-containing protein [Leptospira ilyithenensis]|uniref:LamG domain-containing protein n=1 Tax=Leptospira ilyithenensis TaxID=2484901 RepID=A0A4R9LW72_9LEPT|nr:LamG domain-containing protein [Leptospira ilyithenensis]TGN13362.1 LamG domain-containing protein [Leptospira ilyithenensis]